MVVMQEYIGTPIQWDELLRISIYYRKLNLVAKLEALNPKDYDLFFSDGCSMWPDEWRLCNVDLSWACFWHDVAYYLGGSEAERHLADIQLYRDVLRVAGPAMAFAMYNGVRAGGWIPGTGFEWGYGKLNK